MTRRLRVAHPAIVAILALALVPAALAVKPAESGSAAGCTQADPGVSIDNTWAWAAPGSWGMPGQQLKYAINVRNMDLGCGTSSFTISVAAASGFSVSVPQSTITLNSATSGYLWAYVTSPSTVADGTYPVSVTVARPGAGTPGAPSTSYYKVYSSDAVAPKQYWMNPTDGGTLSGRSTYVGFASSDDHALRQLDVVLDNAVVATTLCDNITYECQLSYKWTIRRVRGQHKVTFRSTDWVGNVSSYTANFTVN
jgi:hypothetical protein